MTSLLKNSWSRASNPASLHGLLTEHALGVVVVPLGRPAEAQIQIISVITDEPSGGAKGLFFIFFRLGGAECYQLVRNAPPDPVYTGDPEYV